MIAQRVLLAMLLMDLLPGVVLANPAVPVVRESLEWVMKKLGSRWGRELVEEGAGPTRAAAARLLARHGDDAAEMIAGLSPRAIKLAADLPDDALRLLVKQPQVATNVLHLHGETALYLVRQYGDDAINVLARHPGVGKSLTTTLGKEALPTLVRLDPTSGARLAKMLPEVAQLPPASRATFLEALKKGGDDFVTWTWKRRKELFGSAMLGVGVWTTYSVGSGIAEYAPAALFPPPTPPLSANDPAWLRVLDRARWPLAMIVAGATAILFWRPWRRPVPAPESSKKDLTG